MTNPEHIEPGQRFGKLLVIGSVFNQNHGVNLWHCQCDCGNIVDMLKFAEPVNNRFERTEISCGCIPWISDFESMNERNQRLKREKPRPADWKDGRAGNTRKRKAIKAAITSNRL